MKYLRQKGFTLVELLIVIGILGILAVGLLTVLDPFSQIQRANDGKRKADLSQIQKALELYYEDKGVYPQSTQTFHIKSDQLGVEEVAWGGAWEPYMQVLPKDPNEARTYVYVSTGQSYYLYANLEKGAKDPNACANGTACPSALSNGVESRCGSGTAPLACNYAVTSPNVSP